MCVASEGGAARARTISIVSSSTRFMNWSKPRSVPCTVRFPLSLTAGTQRGNTTVRIGAEEEIKPTLYVDHKERATWWRAVRVLSSFLSMYLRGAMAVRAQQTVRDHISQG